MGRAPLLALLALLLLAAATPGRADTGEPTTQPGASTPNGEPAPAAEAPSPPDLRRTRDYRASRVRTVIALAALVVFAWRPRGASPRLRRGALLLLAVGAYASYYQFFRFGHADGFATSDNFHYYVGSKYFPELGYFGLYECGLNALAERGVVLPGGARPTARDLRSMEIWPAAFVHKHGEDCSERFTPERWRAFRADVGYFVEKWPPHIRNAVWSDHGYHPPPAWTLVGGTVGAVAPLERPVVVRVLARADRVLVAATLLFLAWAFGLEVACLAAVLWGTGHLWRYTWLGDAYLRHLWWIAALGGIGALRRARFASGGAALAVSALLRLFPGAFALGYLAGQLRAAMRERRLPPEAVRFVAGAALASIVVVALALVWIGQGAAPIVTFAAKIGAFTQTDATNEMGLGVAARFLVPGSAVGAGLLRATAALAFLALFWRGLRDCEPWEAAAFGFALIPILTDPTNYYYSFFVAGTVLAARRPAVGVILLATGVLWGVNGLVFYRQYTEFPAASLIAVTAVTAVGVAMTRPPARAHPPEAAS